MAIDNKKIVIFSNSRDEHVHAIIKEIQHMSGNVFRVDTDRLASHFTLHCNISDNVFTFSTPVGKIVSSEITSLWIRRPYILRQQATNIYEKLIMDETYAMLKGLVAILPPTTRVVDTFDKIINASNKLEGLRRAKKFNLRIPDSIVSTSIPETKEFISRHNSQVIVKGIDTSAISFKDKSLAIPTSILKSDIDLNLIRNCPTFIQEKIEKKSELRITIIGNKVFPVEFSTQHIPEARIDSRMSYKTLETIPHKRTKLPVEIEIKILKLVRSYNLHYAAIDMAITPKGEFVFFELNPSGQFLWLDFVTPGLHLGKEMAKYLLGKE